MSRPKRPAIRRFRGVPNSSNMDSVPVTVTRVIQHRDAWVAPQTELLRHHPDRVCQLSCHGRGHRFPLLHGPLWFFVGRRSCPSSLRIIVPDLSGASSSGEPTGSERSHPVYRDWSEPSLPADSHTWPTQLHVYPLRLPLPRLWLRPRRDAKEQHLAQRPDMVGEPRRHGGRPRLPALGLSPSRASAQAGAESGVRWREVSRYYSTRDTSSAADASRPRPNPANTSFTYMVS